MLCIITKWRMLPILFLFFLLLPLGNCARIKAPIEDWYEDIEDEFHSTKNPFDWNKITVPNVINVDDDPALQNYESFKIFLYVVLTVVFGMILCVCYKHCLKSCSNRQRQRNERRQNYTRVSGNVPGRRHQYERMRTNTRRTQRLTLILDFDNEEENPLADESSDRPPDYFSVVKNDFTGKQVRALQGKPQNNVETPPPRYEEHAWNPPNVLDESQTLPKD